MVGKTAARKEVTGVLPVGTRQRMQRCARLWAFVLLQLLLIPVVFSAPTPLDRYVGRKDAVFSFKPVKEVKSPAGTYTVLELTSQKWRSCEEVKPCVWKHWLSIFEPESIKHNTALLIIAGGSNDRPPPGKPSKPLVLIGSQTGSVACELRMVPNQPTVFPPEKRKRYEDAILAYTWKRFLQTGDSTWPGQLPMAKSAVRAMDAVQSYIRKRGIESFVVTGASKRGWTTWLTAAVDKRVRAIIPVVIDVLNVEPSMRHHHRSYGFWAPAIHDYVEEGVIDALGTPAARKLFSFVDPYAYRTRYRMPKYIINATGDQFFLPDSWQFYFNDLPGEKYLRYVPNADHSLRGSRAWEELLSFYKLILEGKKRPRFSWRLREDGSWVVKPQDRPQKVVLWSATNPEARDFRLQTIGKAWKPKQLEPSADGTYVGKAEVPEKGWTAYFVELTYRWYGRRFVATTGVHVLPEKLPY